MKLLKVDDLETARGKLLACISDWKLETERVSIEKASGRVLSADVFSGQNVPAFNRSTVDGFAVISSDTAAASDSVPVFLELAGRIEMGQAADCKIVSGQCAELSTGGMLPEGADAAVMLEYTERFGNGVAVAGSVATGENTVLAGEDMRRGGLLLGRGALLSPRHIGAAAAAGITELPVYRPLKLAVISTGDEVVSPKLTLSPGQVYDINSYALEAQAEQSGYKTLLRVLLHDDEELLRRTVEQAMADCDVVLVSGGSSKGTKDATARVLDSVSSPGVFTHGLALRPGKPTILGYDKSSRTILGGLPGHPVSAMMVFELVFAWLWRELTGSAQKPAIPAKLSVNLASAPGRLNCWPVSLEWGTEHWTARPVFGKSGLITTLCNADGFFTVERGREGIDAGEIVRVNLF